VLSGIKHTVFGNICLNYLKRQYIKISTNSSKDSVCTDGLWVALIFSLGLGEKWFQLDVFSSVELPCTKALLCQCDLWAM